MTWKEAFDIAEPAWKILRDHCQKCKIAGSIRRRKEIVKDIELVLVPKTIPTEDLFGNISGHERTLDFVLALESIGKVRKGSPSDGRYVKLTKRVDALNQDVAFDVFITTPEDFGRQFAIRTGSAKYSAVKLAKGWSDLGWCGTPGGLRRKVDCEGKIQTSGKMKWTLRSQNPELPPAFTDEKKFFEFLGIPWVKPQLREI